MSWINKAKSFSLKIPPKEIQLEFERILKDKLYLCGCEDLDDEKLDLISYNDFIRTYTDTWTDIVSVYTNSGENDLHINVYRLVKKINYASSISKYKDEQLFYYWEFHIADVINKILAITRSEPLLMKDANLEDVVLAALLHDIASIIDFDSYAKHHKIGPKRARTIMRICNIPLEQINRVCNLISSHRGSVNNFSLTTEEKILTSADGLSNIENFTNLQWFIFNRVKYSSSDGIKWLSKKIRSSHYKIHYGDTPELRVLVEGILKSLYLQQVNNKLVNNK